MSSVVSQDPEVLGGEPVFAGTRVPVKSLFDHLEGGDSIEDFLEGFPSVQREQVLALLQETDELIRIFKTSVRTLEAKRAENI